MAHETSDSNTIRSYLLGTLAPDEQQRVEERLLTDEDFFLALQAEEDELIDDYLSGALTAAERAQGERLFLALPERRRKLTFAKSLRRYIAAHAPAPPAPDPVGGRFAFFQRPFATLFQSQTRGLAVAACCLLLITCGAVWLGLRSWQGRDETARREQSAPNTGSQTAPTPRQSIVAPAEPGASVPPVFVAAFAPGLTRSDGQTNRLTIPPDANTVQLQLALTTDEYAHYRATLRANGTEVFAAGAQRAEVAGAKYVLLNVPAQLVPPGDYQVLLSGAGAQWEEIGKYNFRVMNNRPPTK